MRKNWTTKDIKFMVDNHGVLTLDEMAEALGVTRNQAACAKYRFRICTQAREEKQAQIASLAALGLTTTEIAPYLGVHRSTVHNIARGLPEDVQARLRENGRRSRRNRKNLSERKSLIDIIN